MGKVRMLRSLADRTFQLRYLYIAPKTLPPAQGEPVKPGGSGEAGQPGQTEESTPEEAKG